MRVVGGHHNPEPETGFFDPGPSAASTSQQTGPAMTPDMTDSSDTDDDIGRPPPLRSIDTTGVCPDTEEFNIFQVFERLFFRPVPE